MTTTISTPRLKTIYNEEIRDLLNPAGPTKLEMKDLKKGSIIVGLTRPLVKSKAELLLQIAERVIRQLLLVAQRVRQPVHRLLPRPALARTLGDLQVLHQLVQLLQQRLRLGGAALFHQLLQ